MSVLALSFLSVCQEIVLTNKEDGNVQTRINICKGGNKEKHKESKKKNKTSTHKNTFTQSLAIFFHFFLNKGENQPKKQKRQRKFGDPYTHTPKIWESLSCAAGEIHSSAVCVGRQRPSNERRATATAERVSL